MTTIKRCIFLVGVLLFMGKASQAQDQHFSQYFNQPMYLNPAMTGMFNGQHQLSLIYRNQWSQVHRAYHHSGFGFDTKFGSGWAGGIQALNQSAGDAGYSRTTALLNGSYDIMKANPASNHLVIGAQLGFIQQSYDGSKATLGSQYIPGSGYDPANPSGENFGTSSQIDVDATIGLTFFTGSAQKRFNYFLGAAISHITTPDISFNNTGDKIPLKYVAHGGIRYQASQNIILNPIGMLYFQGESFNHQYGLNAQLSIPSSDLSLIGGLSYRQNDAFIPMMGLRYMDLTVMLSYDINTTDLKSISQTSPGAFEISLIYLFHKRNYEPKFICPRL